MYIIISGSAHTVAAAHTAAQWWSSVLHGAWLAQIGDITKWELSKWELTECMGRNHRTTGIELSSHPVLQPVTIQTRSSWFPPTATKKTALSGVALITTCY